MRIVFRLGYWVGLFVMLYAAIERSDPGMVLFGALLTWLCWDNWNYADIVGP